MDMNETTILEGQSVVHPNMHNQNISREKTGLGEKMAYAAGGAVVGAGATIAGQAYAANDTKPVVAEENLEKQEVESHEAMESIDNPQPEDSPTPEESIIATADGVRVAQVDDDVPFAQAFADARAQVGPGGVFEWHGKAFSTYYKDEWEQMSPQERHDYQASINYQDVISDDTQAQHYNDMAQRPISTETQGQAEDYEIKVIAEGSTDLNGDGVAESSAVVEVDGHQILIVDIDNDGQVDVAVADVDNNGTITDNEIADLTGQGVQMPSSAGDNYFTQTDSQPDYMNDADTSLYEI